VLLRALTWLSGLQSLQKEGKKMRVKRQQEDTKAADLGKAPVKRVPRTIENTREKDPTIIRADDEDVAMEEEQDEFAAHFRNDRPPNVLLTTSYKSSLASYKFCADLLVCCCHRLQLCAPRSARAGLSRTGGAARTCSAAIGGPGGGAGVVGDGWQQPFNLRHGHPSLSSVL
jgi:hypothetical protein